MNDVVIGKSKKTGKDVTMSQGSLYKGDPKLSDIFYRFVDWYCGYTETSASRHGIYSVMGRRRNSYLYDHPALKNLCHTAFTNGDAIFFNADFFQELLALRHNPNGPSFNTLEFVYTHELCHIIKEHFSRMGQYSMADANIFGDMNINLEIMRTFPWALPEEWAKNFIGFRDADPETGRKSDKERFGDCSEEAIARILIKDRNDILKGKGIKPEDATDKEKSDAMAEALGADENPGEDHDHTITSEELAEALIEAGDSELAKALGVHPDMTDDEKTEAIQKAKDRLSNDLAEAQNERKQQQSRAGAPPIPGGHMEDFLDTQLRADRKPKLEWKLAVTEMIAGEGMHTLSDDGIPDDIYFIDPATTGFEDEVYLPGIIPSTQSAGSYLWINDTSASMSDIMIEDNNSELRGIFDQFDDDETKVFMTSADTIARGIALEVNADNVDEVLQKLVVYGRGGTDLTRGINSSIKLIEEQFPDFPIKGIIFSTDLGDVAPRRNDLPANLPPVLFLTPPECYNANFVVAVEDYARVVPVDGGVVADMEFEPESLPVP